MLFTSLAFFILTLITLFLYYLPFMRRWQVPLLIVASWVFYGWSSPSLLALLIISVLLNSGMSYYITYYKSAQLRKLFVTFGVVLNLGILATFKYAGLIGSLFVDPSEGVGAFLVSIPLPVGISFYTFQGISLLIDVYQDRTDDKDRALIPKNLGKALMNQMFYIGFFPQLVAGPIVKAHEFLPQIRNKFFQDIPWELAFRALITGYFLKAVVADNLAEFTHELSYPSLLTAHSLTLLTQLLGYSVQIFADFAGYSLIAIGLCHLFGYKLMDNFNFPYISKSITEFWRRWHISLSTWLREYLYIPLGGNRKGNIRTYINLMIVMLLGGLWHGAAWSYLVWGGYHGLWLLLERFAGKHITVPKHPIVDGIRMVWVFVLATIGWLLFKLNDFSHVLLFVEQLATQDLQLGGIKTPLVVNVIFYSIPIFLYHALYLYRGQAWVKSIRKHDYVFYAIMIFMLMLNTGSSTAFIYFQF